MTESRQKDHVGGRMTQRLVQIPFPVGLSALESNDCHSNHGTTVSYLVKVFPPQ